MSSAMEADAVWETANPFKPILADERPKIQLPGDNWVLSECAHEIGQVLTSENIFERGGFVFILSEQRDRLVLMTPDTFRTWIENYLVLYKVRKVGDAEQLIEFRRTISVPARDILGEDYRDNRGVQGRSRSR